MENKISFTDRMAAASDKISKNIILQSVSQGIMMMLPVIILGSHEKTDYICVTGLSSFFCIWW
jgi:cellobiose-specific phosphotransferase system component IIC